MRAKGIIVLATMLALSVSTLFGQKFGVVLAPQKTGCGVSYIHTINKDVSFVAFATTGKYTSGKSLNTGQYVTSSVIANKYSVGFKYKQWILTYNKSTLNRVNDYYKMYNLSKVYIHSFDIGGLVDINDRVSSGFTYDPLNYEGAIHFIVNLKSK